MCWRQGERVTSAVPEGPCGRSVLFAAALFVSAPEARAAEAYRFTWSRAEGADACLDEDEIAARVRARLATDPFRDSAARIIEGHVAPIAGGFRADLVVRTRDGDVLGRRTIETPGDDCGPLGQAVTLAVILTIDPNAPLLLDESKASFPIDDAPPIVVRAEDAPTAVEHRPLPFVPTCPSCPPEPAGIGLRLGIAGAVGLLPRPALGAELEGAYPALSSGFVLGIRFLPSVQTSDGLIALGTTSGKIGYCGALLHSRVALSSCGFFEAGVTTVVARELVPVDPGDYPYLALSAGPRLVWPSRSPLALHAGLHGVVPLFRQRFRIETTGSPGFQAKSLAASAFVGIGLRE